MKTELRKLLKDLWPYQGTIVVVALTGILMSLAESRIAFEVKKLIDGLEAKDAAVIASVPLVILGLKLISSFARYFHLYLMNVAADKLTVELRKRLQNKFMNLSVSFHTNFKTGSGGLISRILNDIVEIQHGLRLVADVFREPVLFVCLIGALFYFDWQLTLSLLLILPPLVWFLGYLAKSLRKYGHKSQEVMEELTSTIKESLDGVRTIQSFNLESEMNRRFDVEAEKFISHRKQIHSRTEVSGPVTEIVATCAIIAIFTYMGIRIINGEATFGDVFGYLTALLMLQKPIKKIQESFVKVQQTLVSIKRVYDILESDDPVDNTEKTGSIDPYWDKISFDAIKFQYSEKEVLSDVNLEIRRGEVIAFVGASGSGKSTLVNMLVRFYDPTSGRVTIGDQDIRHIPLSDLRRNVALVSQDVFLFRDTIERNIQAGDFSKKAEDVVPAARSANAHTFISNLPDGYQTKVGDRGNTLSGGEKQRVSIARAIYKNAPIIILDEATSALDSASEADVQAGLEELMQGRTVLVVAHRLSTIMNADRIVVLKEGTIREIGSHSDLLKKDGEYKRFFDLQQG